VLAAICLSVISLSFEADAQPTIDETASCGSSTPGEVANMFRVIASSQQENAEKISDVKELLESKMVDCDSAQPSKQALVSALVCEFLVSFMPALSSSPIKIDAMLLTVCAFMHLLIHRVSKSVPPLACYNFDAHEWILIFLAQMLPIK